MYQTPRRGNVYISVISFDLPEKAIALYSSTLAWKIRWPEEPGGLPSMGSQSRTRLSDLAAAAFGLHNS